MDTMASLEVFHGRAPAKAPTSAPTLRRVINLVVIAVTFPAGLHQALPAAAGISPMEGMLVELRRQVRPQTIELQGSARGLLNTLAVIAGRKAGSRSLGDTWADTTSAYGHLMLTLLAGLAEFERALIRARKRYGSRISAERSAQPPMKPSKRARP